jgi:hypothetical protein
MVDHEQVREGCQRVHLVAIFAQDLQQVVF